MKKYLYLFWIIPLSVILASFIRTVNAQSTVNYYPDNLLYPATCSDSSGTCLFVVDSDYGLDIEKIITDTLTVVDATSASGTVTIFATSTSPVLTVKQYGTGAILQLQDADTTVFSVIDGGAVVLESGDTIKNDSASTTLASGNFQITGTNLIFPSTRASLFSGSYEVFRGNLSGGTDVNYLSATSSATGVDVELGVNGSDANIDLLIKGKGTGNILITNLNKLGIGTSTPEAKLSASSTDNIVAIFDGRNNNLNVMEVRSAGRTVLSVASTTAQGGMVTLGNGAGLYGYYNSSATTTVAKLNASSTLDVYAPLSLSGGNSTPVNSFDTIYNFPANTSATVGNPIGGVFKVDGNTLMTLRGSALSTGGVGTLSVAIGTTTPEALLFVESASTTVTTFRVLGKAGQVNDLVQVASSTGDMLFNITSVGKIGVGTSTPIGILDVYGSVGQNAVQITTTTTIASFYHYVDVNSTSNEVGVELGTSLLSQCNQTTHRSIVIKDVAGQASSKGIYIYGQAAQTIDGVATSTISTDYGSATIYCNGTAWFNE